MSTTILKRLQLKQEFENPAGWWRVRPATSTNATAVTGPLSEALLLAAMVAHETKAAAERGTVARVAVIVTDAYGGVSFTVEA